MAADTYTAQMYGQFKMWWRCAPARDKCSMVHVLDRAGGALLPFITMKQAAALRGTCRAARAAVAEYPWWAGDLIVHRNVDTFCASFPRMRTLCVEASACRGAALRHVPHLQHLDVTKYGHGMCTDDVLPIHGYSERVLDVLQYVPHLQTLGMYDCELMFDAEVHTKEVFAAYCTELKFWAVSCEWTHSLPLRTLTALSVLPKLTTLFLQGCKLGVTGAQALAEHLVYLPELRVLDVRRNFLGDNGALHIVESAARHTRRLEYLGLSSNGFRTYEQWARRLPNLPCLQSLDLSCNLAQNTPVWAEVLPRMPQLKILELGTMRLSDHGMQALKYAAPSLQHLTVLILSGNCLGQRRESVYDLETTVAQLPQLEWLDLSYNPIHSADLMRVMYATWPLQMEHLHTLALHHMEFGDDGAYNLAELIRGCHFPVLQTLTLQHNLIGTSGARALTDVVHQLPLRYLNLEGNRAAASDARALKAAAARLGATVVMPQVTPSLPWPCTVA